MWKINAMESLSAKSCQAECSPLEEIEKPSDKHDWVFYYFSASAHLFWHNVSQRFKQEVQAGS